MPKDWQTHWQDSNISDDKRNHSITLLGNKTLLTSPLNKSIKNECWKIKKEGKPSKNIGGLETYAKGLKTFQFENIDIWNEKNIEDRTEFLYNKIIQVWNYDLL